MFLLTSLCVRRAHPEDGREWIKVEHGECCLHEDVKLAIDNTLCGCDNAALISNRARDPPHHDDDHSRLLPDTGSTSGSSNAIVGLEKQLEWLAASNNAWISESAGHCKVDRESRAHPRRDTAIGVWATPFVSAGFIL